MPYKWIENKIAVEKEEICLEYWDKESLTYKRAKKIDILGSFWNTYNALKIELYRYKNKPYGLKRLTLGGNGRKLLVDFDTLPRDIQEFLGDPRKADNPLEKYFNVKHECIEYYSTFKRLGKYLEPGEQEKYVINATVIEAALEYLPIWKANRISLGGSTKGAHQNLLNEVVDFNKWLQANQGVTHSLPGNLRTFKKALTEFEDKNYYSIIRDPEGKTAQNARKVDERVFTIIEGLFIDIETKPNQTDIARSYTSFKKGEITVYNEETGEQYNPDEFPVLSNATISAYLAKWESTVATHKKRAGNRQLYINKFVPHAQMELPKYAGSLITVDDRQPPFWYEKGKRMWFYVGFDAASRCVTTFVYGKSKEGIIMDFYRQMVRDYAELGFGLPYEIECESSLNSSFKDSFLKPGRMFSEVKIESNNARSKYAERLIGELRQIEKKSPGWIARPHAKAESNQMAPGKTKIIPYDQLAQLRIADIQKMRDMPHPDKPEMTRWEYFLNYQHDALKPINWTAILPHLGLYEETSCEGGFIKLQYEKRAIAENGSILKGDELINKFKQIEGKKLDVYWLDGNNGEVLKALAFYKGRLVCEVLPFPKFVRAKLEQTEEDRKAIAIQKAYINTVTGFAKDRTETFEKISIGQIDTNDKAKYEEVEVFDDTTEEDQEIIKYNYSEDIEIDAFANYRN
jgi:hypothetical protein